MQKNRMIIVDGHSGCQTVCRLSESPAGVSAERLLTYIKQNVVANPAPKKLECILSVNGTEQTLSPQMNVPNDAVVFIYFTKQDSDSFGERFPTSTSERYQNILLSLRCLDAPMREYFNKVGHEISQARDLSAATQAKVDYSRDELPHLRRTLEEMALADPTAECRTLADRIPLAQIADSIQKARTMTIQVANDIQQITLEFEAFRKHFGTPEPASKVEPHETTVSPAILQNLMQEVAEKLHRLSNAISDMVKLQKRTQKATQMLKAVRSSLVPFDTAANLPLAYPRAVEAATRRTILRRATSRLLNLLREEQESVQQLNSQFLKEFGQTFPTSLIPGLGRNLPPLIAEEDEVAKYMDPHVQDLDEDKTHVLLERLVPNTLTTMITSLQREKVALAEKIRDANEASEAEYQLKLATATDTLVSTHQAVLNERESQIERLRCENASLKEALAAEREINQQQKERISSLEKETAEMQTAIEGLRTRWCSQPAANSSSSGGAADDGSSERSDRGRSSWKSSVEDLDSSVQFKSELIDTIQKELQSKETIVQILHEQQKNSLAASSSATNEASAARDTIMLEAAALVGQSRWFLRRGSKYETVLVHGVTMEVVSEYTRAFAEDCVQLRITKVVDTCGKTVRVEAVPC